MKKITKYVSLLFCICFILSCSLQSPKSVILKSKAKYNFCIGEISKDLSNDFSVDDFLKQEEESSIKIYDYKPEGENQKIKKLLMEIPVQQIPLDFTSYFEETDISETLGQMSFNQKISVPNFENQNLLQKIDISPINQAINDSVTIGGANNPALDLIFNDEDDDSLFESISYSSGKITVQAVEPANGELFGDIILKYKNKIVSQATFINGIAELSLKDVTLYSQGMSIEFTHGLGNIYWIGFVDGQVKSAKGITLEPTCVEINEELELDFSDESFDSCIVGEGNLGINIEIPEQWEGVKAVYSVNLSGTIDAITEESSEEKNISLKGKKFIKDNLKLSSQPIIYIKKGDLYFDEQPEIEATLQIDKIESVSILLQDDITTSFNQEEPFISENATTMLKEICFTKSGLNISFKNTLPEGNDISILAKSDFLKIDETEKITSEKAEGNVQIVSKEENIQTINQDTTIDFSAQVILPGCTSPEERTITVKNVLPGKEYELLVDIEQIIEWKYVKVDTSSFSQKDTISTEVNIDNFTKTIENMMGTEFEGKFSIPELNTYLFVSKPENEVLKDVQFMGEISVFQGKLNNEKYEPIDPESKLYLLEEGDSLEFVPTLNLQKEENSIYTDIENLKYSAGPFDFASLLIFSDESEQTSLCIDYDLSFSDENSSSKEITISREDLDKASTSSIDIMAMVVVPISLKVNEDLEIDLMKLMNSDNSEGSENSEEDKNEEPKDILGRTEDPDSDEENNQIIDLIESCSLTYKDTNLPFVCENLKLLIDFNPNDKKAPTELSLSGGTIKISPEEIFDIYPLVPEIKLKIPKGDSLSVAQKLTLKANLSICLETNDEISLFGGKK